MGVMAFPNLDISEKRASEMVERFVPRIIQGETPTLDEFTCWVLDDLLLHGETERASAMAPIGLICPQKEI